MGAPPSSGTCKAENCGGSEGARHSEAAHACGCTQTRVHDVPTSREVERGWNLPSTKRGRGPPTSTVGVHAPQRAHHTRLTLTSSQPFLAHTLIPPASRVRCGQIAAVCSACEALGAAPPPPEEEAAGAAAAGSEETPRRAAAGGAAPTATATAWLDVYTTVQQKSLARLQEVAASLTS